MFFLYLQEMKRYFLTWQGYCLLSLSLFFSGILLYFTNLSVTNSSLQEFMVILPFYLIIFIPMIVFTSSFSLIPYHYENIIIDDSFQPVDFVLAKYLTGLTLYSLTLLIITGYTVFLYRKNMAGVGEFFSILIGLFLFGAAILALGFFIACFIKQDKNAGLITLFILLTGYSLSFLPAIALTELLQSFINAAVISAVSAFIIYAISAKRHFLIISMFIFFFILMLWYYFDKNRFLDYTTYLISWFSPLNRFRSFTIGLIRLDAIIYELSFTFLFLLLTEYYIIKPSYHNGKFSWFEIG